MADIFDLSPATTTWPMWATLHPRALRDGPKLRDDPSGRRADLALRAVDAGPTRVVGPPSVSRRVNKGKALRTHTR
jgi:hypothetical protein